MDRFMHDYWAFVSEAAPVIGIILLIVSAAIIYVRINERNYRP